jgi:flagellar operon protein
LPNINGISLPFVPAGGMRDLKKAPNAGNLGKSSVDFRDVFNEEFDKLKFSAHAQSRISSRDIDLSASDITRLEDAVKKVEDKGGNESLIMLDEKAFIVNIPNKTVITVVGQDQMDDRVVTQIDSAVFA